MGYYTDYQLEVLGSVDDNLPKEIFEELDLKWYEHEKDVKEISLKYNYCIFILYGIGEEYDDLWKKIFINGNLIAKIDGEIVFKDEEKYIKECEKQVEANLKKFKEYQLAKEYQNYLKLKEKFENGT